MTYILFICYNYGVLIFSVLNNFLEMKSDMSTIENIASDGSIGYWLHPEIGEKLTHDEGVLGACLNEDPNSAACRFYILAVANPNLDGKFTIFGRVTKGLDIVRTINNRAVYKEADESKYNHLKEPVLIRSVTVHAD